MKPLKLTCGAQSMDNHGEPAGPACYLDRGHGGKHLDRSWYSWQGTSDITELAAYRAYKAQQSAAWFLSEAGRKDMLAEADRLFERV